MNKKVIGLLILSLMLIPAVALAVVDGWNVGNYMEFGLPFGSITGILLSIMLWILRIFGIVGIIGFVISGILYLTAAGDEDRMQSAKRAMQYSIIGVVVGLLGLVILQAVDWALNSMSGF